MIKILSIGLKNINRIMAKPVLNKNLQQTGESIMHSKNPFIGDYFVSNGVKLANGPRSFSKQLNKMGFDKYYSKKLVDSMETNPDLYTVFSRELNDIPTDKLKNSQIYHNILEDLNNITNYLKKNPNAIHEFRGYGRLIKTNLAGNGEIRPNELIEKDILDFYSAEKLLSSIKKHSECRNETYNIPNILKNDKLPEEELFKIFDNALILTREKTEMCRRFDKTIIPECEKDTKQLSGLLEELVNKLNGEAGFSVKDIKQAINFLKRIPDTELIAKFAPKGHLPEYFNNIYNKQQQKLVSEYIFSSEAPAYNTLFSNLLKPGILETSEQCKMFKVLNSPKMVIGNKTSGDYIRRFSISAQRDILKNIKNDLDYQLAKSMIEKNFVNGKPLYSTEAILRILEQDNKTKEKAFAKLSKPLDIDVETYNKALGSKRWSKGEILQTSPFQKEIKTYAHNTPIKELAANTKVGEVIQAGEKLLVNNGSELVELKMTREVFDELFMQGDYIKQGFLGDCGFVASIDAIMSTPKGKAAVYSLFEQIPGSKDILIRLKNSSKEIKFINNEFEEAEYGRGMHHTTSKGLRILEQALAASRVKDAPNNIVMYKDFIPNVEIMDRTMEGILPQNVFEAIFSKQNVKETFLMGFESNFKSLIKNVKAEQNKVALYATNTNSYLGSLFKNICNRHWHNIKKINPDMSMNITNPHNTSFYTKAPYYETTNSEMMQFMDIFEII